MIIRPERDEDRAEIFAVHSAAFGGGPDVVEARLVEELRADGAAVPALSLVATPEGAVVGHVVCSRARVDQRPLLGLGPLGVLPRYQRRGVGSALMHAVLAAADALDEPGVALLGEPAYYRRFGFRPAVELGVLAPDPGWGAYFQVRPPRRWDDRLRGAFHYAAAFDRTGAGAADDQRNNAL